jgi:hypothetical protein
MASVIKLKRNTNTGVSPSGGDLQAGELAINLADKKLFSSTDGTDVIQISGDAYDIDTIANTTSGTIKLTGTGNAANSFVNITGANGIGITSDGSGAITITANTVDVDFATAANTSSANLSVASGANTDVVKLSGNNGLVVAATNTTNVVVENKGAQHIVTVVSDGGNKYAIDGTTQQDLRLVPGVIYWFDQSDSSNGSHPLAFGTAANGSEVSQGTASGFKIYEQVGTPGSAGAYTRVQLQQDAPNHLYYFCESHSGMGADVYVQPDNLYSNATHVIATQPLNVTGLVTGSAGLDITGLANISGNTILSDSLTVADGLTISASGATITGAVDITGAANVSSTLGVDGVVDIDDTTESANVESGSLITAGGVGIAKSLYVGEHINVTNTATFSNNVTIGGTLTVAGGTTTVESTTVTINDSLLSLADNQTGTDTDAVDVGFYGTFDEGGTDKYSGIFRDQDHANKAFVIVEGITSEPGSTISYSASDLGQLDAVIDGGTY